MWSPRRGGLTLSPLPWEPRPPSRSPVSHLQEKHCIPLAPELREAPATATLPLGRRVPKSQPVSGPDTARWVGHLPPGQPRPVPWVCVEARPLDSEPKVLGSIPTSPKSSVIVRWTVKVWRHRHLIILGLLAQVDGEEPFTALMFLPLVALAPAGSLSDLRVEWDAPHPVQGDVIPQGCKLTRKYNMRRLQPGQPCRSLPDPMVAFPTPQPPGEARPGPPTTMAWEEERAPGRRNPGGGRTQACLLSQAFLQKPLGLNPKARLTYPSANTLEHNCLLSHLDHEVPDGIMAA